LEDWLKNNAPSSLQILSTEVVNTTSCSEKGSEELIRCAHQIVDPDVAKAQKM